VFEAFDASPIGAITDFPAAQGITAAAQHCPGVISISFGGTSRDQALEDALLGAFHNGCLIVAAAGNGGSREARRRIPRTTRT
jgi:Subtilase family.